MGLQAAKSMLGARNKRAIDRLLCQKKESLKGRKRRRQAGFVDSPDGWRLDNDEDDGDPVHPKSQPPTQVGVSKPPPPTFPSLSYLAASYRRRTKVE